MRMRAGVWWGAAALALLAVTSALRTSQVEGATRTGRRITAPSAPDSNSVANSTHADNGQPTFRSRSSRRREETPTREVVPTRTRSRPFERTKPTPETERPQPQRGTNERFDSRRTQIRTRTRLADTEAKASTNAVARENVPNRSRQISRRVPTTTTRSPLELSSPSNDESKIEIINSNLDDITKIVPKDDNTATTQFKRRSSISQSTESIVPRKTRGRINTRSNSGSLDLDGSGTTHTVSVADKAPTTVRTSADLRNTRKLRYRTRPSETDSNLTGEGMIALNEVIKSSQNKDNIASQKEIQTPAPVIIERNIPQSTEANKMKTTTLKVTKVVRRPLSRGKANSTPSVSAPKTQADEINEDDNYPETFKALIQAKNASTQASSPTSESLSVKASQKVYKTYSSSSQSTQTGPAIHKYSRLRNKQNVDESKKETIEEKTTVTTLAPELSKSKNSEYKPRGKYPVRNRKSTTFIPSSTTESIVTDQSTEKPAYKYSRKLKITTTESPPADSVQSKGFESGSILKKPFVRPSLYARTYSGRTSTSTERSVVSESEKKDFVNITSAKNTLPRTSYYSRLRKNIKNKVSTTTEALKDENQDAAQNKSEDTVDMPLIFTLLKSSDEKVDPITEAKTENNNEAFVISVSSTESQEINNINEMSNMAAGTENMLVINVPTITTRQDMDRYKYHANYKDQNANNDIEEKTRAPSTVVPPVRNIQTKKYSRKRTKTVGNNIDIPDVTTPIPRDRQSRKFSESYSKTTEVSTNGISSELVKPKSRFSSKYRAAYLDKPFYKPTVPTITSSTAWLKFFVTDHLLTKSVEEPNWFEGDYTDVVTESLPRQNITSPPYIHESSIELVEGEEIQLGPDLNAISFTQTRRTLSSADLKLSESLVKSSQIMNVEASQHSPSVTVSIFDALAEILTSTPRPRLSTTTEVTEKQTINTDVTQILNGVSNTNVNSASGTPSPGTLVATGASSSTTKSVQNTVQTTPNVINSMSAGESVTPSLNTEVVTPANTPQTPIPTPSTPVSARRPFAIKVLYSDTESPIDKPTTARVPTSNLPTTDSPKMVYNTVSDLLLSNNNLVSAELTSMLSNNIKDIIKNMDQDSRSRISVDMAKLLRTLIPRAIDGLATVIDNSDTIPNTTPYSLEDIQDTQNIDINNNSDAANVLRNVVNDSTVNSTVGNSDLAVSNTETPAQTVNRPDVTPGVTDSTLVSSSSQTTSFDSSVTTMRSVQSSSSTISQAIEFTTSSASTDADTVTVNNDRLDKTSTNNNVPLPFFTNFRVGDFTPNVPENNTASTQMTKSLPLSVSVVSSEVNDINVNDPSKISPLQLWVLSKKASVLKMIEDLIRQHNNELATAPPLTDIINPIENINFSERLTNIINNMTSTTESLVTTNDDVTSPVTLPLDSVPLSITTPALQLETTTSGMSAEILSTSSATTSISSDLSQSISENSVQISSRLSAPGATTEASNQTADMTPTTSETGTETASTTPIPTTEQAQGEELNRQSDSISETTLGNTESLQTTTQGNTETTTASVNIETTTQLNVETTTQADVETTTQTDIESTSIMPIAVLNRNSPIVSTLGIATQSTIPKKDYVIFGILPNNTVVRKDPNDDVLESLTEASPFIVYGVLPNNTVIRKFPNGTRVPRVMQKIDILPISPWSLRNPYSPIHNNPAIVRPQSNPIRVSTNTVTSTDITNNGTENRLTTDTISSSALNIKSSSLGITTATNKPPAEKSTASHVLSLRTSTMLPSIDEILLNSLSSAAKQDMVISSMISSTREPRILTLDIDPETQQIRTEKPGEGNGNSVFKFIPIDEVTVPSQNTNVLKLASTKATPTTSTEKSEVQIVTASTVTEMNTPTQTQASTIDSTTTEPPPLTNAPVITTTESTTLAPRTTTEATTTTTTTEATTTTTTTTEATTTTTTTTPAPTTTTPVPTTTSAPTTTQAPTTTLAPTTITTQGSTVTTQVPTTTLAPTTLPMLGTTTNDDIQTIQSLLQGTARDPKNLNVQSSLEQLLLGAASTTIAPTTTTQQNDQAKLLEALLSATGQNSRTLSIPNIGGSLRVNTESQSTTTRSIEDDIRQFEEDTKILKALLQLTGQNPANLNIPTLDSIITTTRAPLITTTPPTSTPIPTTTTTRQTTTQTIEDDIKQFQEDAKLLQALLQATGQNSGNSNTPLISGITSNVRIASNPLTTSIGSNPTTPINIRPVYSTTQPTPVFKTFAPRTISTLQPGVPLSTATEDGGISTTFPPFNQRRQPTTTARSAEVVTLTGRRAPDSRITTTTDIPSTSTFSVQEDLFFLQNLKSVLHTNNNNEDPEAALANRIISLAVEKSLDEIQSGNQPDSARTGKTISNSANNLIFSTKMRQMTTPTTTTTTTPRPITTTIPAGGPSIEDDIKQFQEDTKLLQALLKATGQDPTKFNIPTLPKVNNNLNVSPNLPKGVNDELDYLSNLLASPSPLNEPFDPLTPKPRPLTKIDFTTTTMPFGAKIAVKDDLKNAQDDGKLLQTLIQLQGAQETTTQRSKLAITGQSSDEALKTLLQQAKPTGMVSEATQAPVSLSTEYGKTNDALLAALLKEQGFGPTTASSLDEQLRLAALLNQVVVTPKTRRTTTPPPPPSPPAPRRPILDGLAWLWQQWRETAPGPGAQKPTRRPVPAPRPSMASSPSTSNRVNWFGSGPVVGNADDRPTANRIPLEPPRAVTSEQAPGRGQLVSAAINVTRAFSQFLGAAIQGAAQTVQSVIRAGQRAASDVYTNGSGSPG